MPPAISALFSIILILLKSIFLFEVVLSFYAEMKIPPPILWAELY